ncbi:MAG: hypothetical protein CMM55_00060 [Rhodospirillaceae bacterium]|nr:hypothetical protein [Rhodospirillaceae bacterium]
MLMSLSSRAEYRWLLALFVSVVGVPMAVAQEASYPGFVMGNSSPLSALIGTPGRWATSSDTGWDLTWRLSSHAYGESNDRETLLLDGETHTVFARWRGRLSGRLSIGVEVPWVTHSGGFLDPLIDGWHDFFNLRESIRPDMPQGQLHYVYVVEDMDRLSFGEPTSALGDVGVQAGLRLVDGSGDGLGRWSWTLVLSVDVPTGRLSTLTGNEEFDYGLGLRTGSPARSTSRLRWWLDAGVVVPGDVAIDGLSTVSTVPYLDVAFSWRVADSFELLADVAGSGPLYRGKLRMLADGPVQLGAGFLWKLSDRYSLRMGVLEDLRPDTAEDFSAEFALVIAR